MTKYSFSRADFVGICIGVSIIVMWAVGFWARTVGKRNQDECAYNIRMIHRMYINYVSDGSELVLQPLPSDSSILSSVTAANVFSVFVPVENGNRNLVCPKDKRADASVEKRLKDENLSYCISVSSIRDNPKAILTGGRDLFSSSGVFHLWKKTNSSLNVANGLHGTNRFLGLMDGSVQYTPDFVRYFHHSDNNGNVMVVP
jgi:hypothetical protein